MYFTRHRHKPALLLGYRGLTASVATVLLAVADDFNFLLVPVNARDTCLFHAKAVV